MQLFMITVSLFMIVVVNEYGLIINFDDMEKIRYDTIYLTLFELPEKI